MPVYTIQGPDGRRLRIEADNEANALRGAESFYSQQPTQQQAAAPKEPQGMLAEAAGNIPSSALKLAHDTITPLLHPIDTAKAIGGTVAGLAQKGYRYATGGDTPGSFEQYPDAIGAELGKRYGSLEAAGNTFRTDPVGMAADLSMVLTGGGSLAARAPGIAGRAGNVTRTVGQSIDPFRQAGVALRPAGYVASEMLGGFTGAGGESVRTAFRSGAEGGQAGQTFRENMRGHVPVDNVVDDAFRAVGVMRQERGRDYRAGMVGVSNDPSVLNFAGVDQAMQQVAGVKNFHGVDTSPRTAGVRQEISDLVTAWKGYDPKQFHTVEGFDALKQAIGDIKDSLPYGSPERKIATEAYSAVRDTIVKQAPEYGRVMRDYERASDLIREMEKTLSLNPKASIDTSLRKLQSVMRNNVQANYGRRMELAEMLRQNGATHLMEKLSGQAMNAALPRGLSSRVLAGGGGISAYWLDPTVLAALPAASPRLVGETAHAAGRGSNYVLPEALAAMLLAGRAQGSMGD